MARDIEAILDEVLALPEAQRAELAHRLIVSLDGPAPDAAEQARIDATWSAEIDRRVKAIEDGTANLIPAKEVFAEIEASLKARKRP